MIRRPPRSTLFPTRRSSDLVHAAGRGWQDVEIALRWAATCGRQLLLDHLVGTGKGHCPRDEDRKSTRLNSSHQIISYAVFCLKKKRHIKVPSESHEPDRT